MIRNVPARPAGASFPATNARVQGKPHERLRVALLGRRLPWVRDLVPYDSSRTLIRLDRLPDANARLPFELVVATCDDQDRGEVARAVSAFARSAGRAALGVVLGMDEALVGPLTLPGRAGCWRCAHERIVCASAGSILPEDDFSSFDRAALVEAVREVLSDELGLIARTGLESSRLIEHVAHIPARTLRATVHRFVPLAHCRACGGAAAAPPNDTVTVVRSGLEGWVDPLTGIVPALGVDSLTDERPKSPVVVTAAAPHVLDEDGELRQLPLGWGKGLTIDAAIRSAVGEAVERYSASTPDPGRLVWARPRELAGDRLEPSEFPLYTRSQYERPGFPCKAFDPELPHPWVRGQWLETTRDVWIPAIFAYLSLTLAEANVLAQGSSNGLAASTDLEDAKLRAVRELVERDAFMTAWLTGTPGIRLSLDDHLEPRLAAIVAGIEGFGAELELYLLPTSVVGTTVLCLALGDGARWPGVNLGLASDLDPLVALQGALLEVGQTGPHLRSLFCVQKRRVPAEPREVASMLDHAAYFVPAERKAHFARLRAATETRALSSLVRPPRETTLADYAQRLATAGIRVACVDVTAADVATSPFRVARAVSPDLQPISYGYGMDRVPLPRFADRVLGAELPPIHPLW